MKRFLFVSVLSLFIVSNIFGNDIKYFVDVGKNFKGVLYIADQGDNTFDADYFNITSRDKIPFYAPKKQFSLVKLNSLETLKRIKLNDIDNTLVYDLSKLSADELADADVAKEDIKTSVLIYNKENLVTDILEKRPIHTMESLIVSIFKTKKIPLKPFYLYEPHKRMLIKVEFKKEKTSAQTISGTTCATQQWVLQVHNRNKRLVRVYLTPYPVRVEAFSKRWAFKLKGYGIKKEIVLQKNDIVFSYYKEELEKKYKKYHFQFIKKQVEKDMFDLVYKITFKVEAPINEDDIKNTLPQYLKHSPKFVTSSKNAYSYYVTKDDIYKVIGKKYKIDGDDYLVSKDATMSLYKLVKATHPECKRKKGEKKVFICKGEEEKFDADDLVKPYLEAKYPNLDDVDDIEEEDGYVSFTYTLKNKIDNKMLGKYLKKAFKAKYPKYTFTNLQNVMVDGDEYSLYIAKDDVGNYVCSKKIPGVKAKYKEERCVAIATKSYRSSDAQSVISKYMQIHYPDLSIMGTQLQEDDKTIRFQYLNDLTKVTNECK